MRVNQPIGFSLRLFTWRVRWIQKRTLTLQKNFRTCQKKMTQQQVQIKKRARTIFDAGTTSVEKCNAGHGKRSRA